MELHYELHDQGLAIFQKVKFFTPNELANKTNLLTSFLSAIAWLNNQLCGF